MSQQEMIDVAVLREKGRLGELTLEEAKRIVAFYRGNRTAAMTTSAASKRSKAQTAVKSAEELLAAFGAKS